MPAWRPRAIHSAGGAGSTLQLSLPAGTALSCAKGQPCSVPCQGVAAPALWQRRQPAALPWLCCTCTGLDASITAPSSWWTAQENACDRAGWEPGLAAGCVSWSCLLSHSCWLFQDLTSLPYLSLLRTSCTKNFSESLGLRSKVLQKIEQLRMTTNSVSVPDEFLCPITRELMKDPVIATGMSLHDMN